MDFLQAVDVSKRVSEDGVPAIDGISFSQQAGQKLALVGATGSGKTTLLKMIAGLVQPDEGKILLEGRKIPGPNERLIPGHPEIAYLSQHYELWNNYRVADLLSYANELTDEESASLYAICRIGHLLRRKTDQLSGGERQRIALAQLLVRPPKLLMLDEPYSNLDRVHKDMLRSVIGDILKRYAMSCI